MLLSLVGRKTAVKPVQKRNKILEGFTLEFISKGLNSHPILKNLKFRNCGQYSLGAVYARYHKILVNISVLWRTLLPPPKIYAICWKIYQASCKHPRTLLWMESRICLLLKQVYLFFSIYLARAKRISIANTQNTYPNLRLAIQSQVKDSKFKGMGR